MTNKSAVPDVAVLGAGIMGACLALALAQRGYKVDLIDQADMPVTGASLHNEGKLHLGFVYAKDPTGNTHTIMLRGSLAFARILKQLTGCSADDFQVSAPFQYFVPNDSQLDILSIEDHFQAVEAAIHTQIDRSSDCYLDLSISQFHRRNSIREHARLFVPEKTLASFTTEERAVSPAAVALILRQAVKNQANINFLAKTEVVGVTRLATDDIKVAMAHHQQAVHKQYASVANCLWENKLRIDKSAGIATHESWLLRYKATIHISGLPADHGDIPSATGILGTYGDVVRHQDGSYYLSWYPRCRLAQTLGEDAQGLHHAIHQSELYGADNDTLSIGQRQFQDTFVNDNIRAMATYIPSLTPLLNLKKNYRLGGGIILAKGVTDIDDPDSFLHQRAGIGPRAYGSFISVNTGKYCTAPLFALEAADMMAEALV